MRMGFSAALDKCIEDVTNMAWHLSLKRSIDALWQQAFHQPRDKITYALWDHMVM